MYLKTKSGRLVRLPTDEEDAAITKAALADPDAQPTTDEQWAGMRPASERHPKMVERYLKAKGRGKQKSPTKIQTTIRYSPEVLEYFKSTGDGWQSRMNDVLREYIAQQSEAA